MSDSFYNNGIYPFNRQPTYPNVNMYPSPYLNTTQNQRGSLSQGYGGYPQTRPPSHPYVNNDGSVFYEVPDPRYMRRGQGNYLPNIEPNVPINEDPNMYPGINGNMSTHYYSNKSNQTLPETFMPMNEPQHHGYQQPQMYTGPDMYQGHYQAGELTQEKKHIHEFTGQTETKDGHKHQFTGTTEPAQNKPNHTHSYWAVTEYDDGHRHEMKGETGPAIPVPGGGHVHMIKGETYGYPNHQHAYSDKTDKSMGSLPSYQY